MKVNHIRRKTWEGYLGKQILMKGGESDEYICI